MTDEEKDKTEKEYQEWLVNDHKLLDNPTYCDIEQKCFRAFFAGTRYGLEAGKPKWHDIRKDPNDLPTEQGDYWVIDADGDYSVIYAPIAVKHCDDADMYKALNIVAWCKLPKFEG